MNMVLWSSGEQRWARARDTRLCTAFSATRIRCSKWFKTYPRKRMQLKFGRHPSILTSEHTRTLDVKILKHNQESYSLPFHVSSPLISWVSSLHNLLLPETKSPICLSPRLAKQQRERERKHHCWMGNCLSTSNDTCKIH